MPNPVPHLIHGAMVMIYCAGILAHVKDSSECRMARYLWRLTDMRHIYRFDRDGSDFSKAIEFKYNDKTFSDNVTEEDFRKNRRIYIEYLENPDVEMPLAQLVNSKKIVTIIEVGPDYSRDRYLLLTDRGSGHTYRVETTEDDNVIFPSLYYIDENYLYNILTKEHILENPRCFLNKESEAASLLASIDDEDFVLIKYRFKK